MGPARPREEPPSWRREDFEPRRQAATLFVGDLPSLVTSDELAQLFAQFAPVAEVKVMGIQGYAFVTFHDPETAMHVHRVRHHHTCIILGPS